MSQRTSIFNLSRLALLILSAQPPVICRFYPTKLRLACAGFPIRMVSIMLYSILVDYFPIQGITNQFGSIGQVQLFQDPRPISADRFRAQGEQASDFSYSFPFRQQS